MGVRCDAELIDQIRQKLSAGLTANYIALQLDCASGTVRKYRRQLLKAGELPRELKPDGRPPPQFIVRATRTWPELNEVRRRVERWEAITMAKLEAEFNHNGGDPMPEERAINLECVAADLETDKTMAQAARKYGLPELELKERLQAAGLATAHGKVSLAQVKADVAEGLTYEQIGERRGCSSSHVYRLMKASKKRSKPPGPPPENGHSATNGSLPLPKAQPVVVDAQEAPQNARNGHATNDPVDEYLLARFASLPLIRKLELLLPSTVA